VSTDRLNPRHRILSPVKQNAADGYLLLMICAFGITVILTRLLLELTGYPQLGDSTFHVAHVLWGGLLLFVALVLVLILANHWASWIASLLGGIGTGLFIDEVGKFITQTNDYYFPLAVPIIYAFMLACVWLYFRVRRSKALDTRTLYYHILENLKEVFDDDLEMSENSELTEELSLVAKTAEAESERKLARSIIEFLEYRDPGVVASPNLLERSYSEIRAFLASTPSRGWLKPLLIAGFTLFGIGAFAKSLGLDALSVNASSDWRTTVSSMVVVSGKSQYIVNHPLLLAANLLLTLAVGVLAILSAIIFTVGNERIGLRIGTLGLVLALTAVNLVTFYFNQLYALVDALSQLVLVGLAQWYRWRFLLGPENAL
jgi:hypothetical protein